MTRSTARKERSMTRKELLSLPVTIPLITAGRAFGMGRTKSHELARQGRFPVPVLRVGATYVVRTADLYRELGIEDGESEVEGTNGDHGDNNSSSAAQMPPRSEPETRTPSVRSS